MDNLTHTLFAATLARTPLARAGRGTTAALLLASNAPDIDVVSLAGGTISYVHWHRGPTHGVLGIAGLGVLTAAVVWSAYRLADRRRPGPERLPAASFGMLTAVSMLAVGFHVLMDLPTSYGTRLLSPFDWHWYAFDWLPIIDIYLLAILAIGLIFGSLGDAGAAAARPSGRRTTQSASRRMATVVLVLMGVNYGLRATAHHQALVEGPRLFGPLLPSPCDARAPISQGSLAVWPWRVSRSVAAADPDGRHDAANSLLRGPAQAARPCLVEVAALPTFTSPFRWRLIAHLSNAYELHDVDLLDGRLHDDSGTADRMWRLSIRFPDQWTAATREAAAAPMPRIFLGFARFPSARTFTDARGEATVRWTDVRFAGGLTSLEDRSRRPNPFNLTVRLDAGGRVIAERTGP